MSLNQLSFANRLIIVGIVIFIFAQFYFGFSELPFSWDGFGYYLYLPYTFIYGDLTFSDLSHVQGIVDVYENTDSLYQLTQASNGNSVIKYPVGLAILMSPFFFIGHLIAYVFGYPMDGFSMPYNWMINFSHLFYVVLGLIYLYKVLTHYFISKIALTSLFAVVIGTNFLYMATSHAGNAHIPLFALHSVALYLTIKWHEKQTLGRSLLYGAVIGLMIITRPTEILFLLIPLFWGVKSVSGFFRKYRALLSNQRLNFLVFCIVIILIGFIQLAYWKHVSGEWLFYSYDNPGEGFEFLNPYTFEFLFSYRKGWYIYTPIMLLATIGVILAIRSKYVFNMSLLVFLAFTIWVVSSWSCWWYAGSFSQRSMVQFYPEMAIGLAILLSHTDKYNIWKKIIAALLISFVILNLFQSWQFKNRIIHASRMTGDYYWKVFGKLEAPNNSDKLLLVERATVKKAPIKNKADYIKKETLFNESIIHFNSDQEFVDFKKYSFNDITVTDHAWIKLSGYSNVIKRGAEEDFLMITCFAHNDKKYDYVAWSPTEMRTYHQDSTTNYFEFWYLTPEVRSKKDEFVFEIWNRAKSEVKIEKLKVETFVKK